jgi:hypothetical protein
VISRPRAEDGMSKAIGQLHDEVKSRASGTKSTCLELTKTHPEDSSCEA